MKSHEPGHANSLPELQASAARPEGEDRSGSAFWERLRSVLSCPELAKDFDPSALPSPRKPKWPEPTGRAPMIGNARKVTIQSAHDFCAVTFRVADYGLLMEFSLRIWNYRVRITCDDLTPDSWLFPPPAKS